ncbi:hypothetical protein ACNJN1_24470 [Citrobacter freundii]
MALVDMKFSVVVTFDITVNGKSDVYRKVSDMLEEHGFTKESKQGHVFPDNVYLGYKKHEVEEDENYYKSASIKKASVNISNEIKDLLVVFFKGQQVKNEILIHVGRADTSTTILKFETTK